MKVCVRVLPLVSFKYTFICYLWRRESARRSVARRSRTAHENDSVRGLRPGGRVTAFPFIERKPVWRIFNGMKVSICIHHGAFLCVLEALSIFNGQKLQMLVEQRKNNLLKFTSRKSQPQFLIVTGSMYYAFYYKYISSPLIHRYLEICKREIPATWTHVP